MFRKQKDIIQFVSQIEGLETIEECRPKPAKFYIPEWFKNIPSNNPTSVKKCPSFTDFFSQGYVVPMWVDTKISYYKEIDEWRQESSIPGIDMTFHANNQFIDYVSPYFNGVQGNFVFKANSPWRIITPPGWSVLQLPMFYHFEKDFSVLPGIIHTDIHHEINQQVLYHGEGREVFIPRGTPIAQYIPFKRLETSVSVSDFTVEDSKMFRSQDLNIRSEYSGNYLRRKRSNKN